ncbi:DUF5789 family protein [Halovenus rubra]|uniref:DUF5789 family protein n=2 Tax=Halovenus rubra TaxID=869890 RepID=A0ABD5X4D3_9EURY|nr:DUF5789 family protein [Halovenus rubra]
MTDDSDDEPVIELGDGKPVEGAPLARISARFMWGIEKTTIVEREGETLIRTPDGSRELAEILDDVEHTYFDTRQSFEDAVNEAIGPGIVPTAGNNTEESEAVENSVSDNEDDSTE